MTGPAGTTAGTMDSAGERIADRVAMGYRNHRRQFAELTRRAHRRFETREWAEAQDDARVRILLYDVVLHETLRDLRASVPADAAGRRALRHARDRFADWAGPQPDSEVAETFYNSVVRRLYGTVGVDPGLEFVAGDIDDPSGDPAPDRDRHGLEDGIEATLERVLATLPIRADWNDRAGRVRRAAHMLRYEPALETVAGPGAVLEILRPLFFRNKAAYLVGRIVREDRVLPLVLALTHPPSGVTLDAVLPTADEASVVFGFTRSYMHADLGAPRPTVDFLRSLMPHRRVDELYTAVGFNRHGKTEFYRSLLEALARPDVRFEPTPGQPGLVMAVFALPEMNAVFKVIRDRFGAPKRTTRERVMRKYDLIHLGDRVGRLADAQPFERLELPRDRFHPAVLDELLATAGRTVRVRGNTVVIEHLYTERRVRPLDLYLAEVPDADAERATLDFGQAIKDLAAADIFPGDMLTKNFGVTRHGRVIFYDYDEVAPLTDCRFRDPPPAPFPEADLDDDPQYYVGPDDVFPAEWRAFLGPPGALRRTLHDAHPELFEAGWWRTMQARQREGEVVDFFPYEERRRIR